MSSPRRRKTSATARVRPFWIPIAIAGVLAAVAGAFVVAWPGFEPKQVIVTGNRVATRPEVLARARVVPHVNMWLQDTGAMATRVATIPYVARATVYRVPPNSIVIAIKERTPFAVVRSDERAVLVDHDLRVLQAALDDTSLVEFVVKPGVALEPGAFLRDPHIAQMRDDYDAMIAARVVPVELHFDHFGGLVATVRGGVAILLGDDSDLTKKLALVGPILAQVVRKQSRVAAVDLRAPATPVLVYK
ncbi:MAG: FtsQ-type POTRA domain-containing protein [Candidatus Eremiobacteraeota bacterium]|nr:FtsQ-type POTRA domain-containing protein [Candidatus Eremiobacteraeota bacterium]